MIWAKVQTRAWAMFGQRFGQLFEQGFGKGSGKCLNRVWARAWAIVQGRVLGIQDIFVCFMGA